MNFSTYKTLSRASEKTKIQKDVIQQHISEPKVKVIFPAYSVQEIQRCQECDFTLAEPNNVFWIMNDEAIRYKTRNL